MLAIAGVTLSVTALRAIVRPTASKRAFASVRMSQLKPSSTPNQLTSLPPISPKAMPTNTKVDLDFIKRLHHLDELSPNVYEARFLGYGTSVTGNVYGGLIFAQALAAAEKTVDLRRFTPHAVHGFFILNATPDKPIRYRVDRVRDGRSFSTRSIQAEQEGKIVFISQVSLCVKEPTSIEHQLRMPQDAGDPEKLEGYFPIARRLISADDGAIAAAGKGGEEGHHPLPKRARVNLQRHLAEEDNVIFEFRPSEPKKYIGLEPSQPTQPGYNWMRSIMPIPDDISASICNTNDTDKGAKSPADAENSDNDGVNGEVEESSGSVTSAAFHRFLLAYITDSTLVSAANRPHYVAGYTPSMLYSLDHSIHFHDHRFRVDDWLLYENFSNVAGGARAFSEGRVWTKDGRLVLTAFQESLSRTRGSPSKL